MTIGELNGFPRSSRRLATYGLAEFLKSVDYHPGQIQITPSKVPLRQLT